MKQRIGFLFVLLVLCLPISARAQDLTAHPDMPFLIDRYRSIPHIEQLLSKSLEGTVSRVIIVEKEVGDDDAKVTQEPVITGRIESISYDMNARVARIVLFHDITVIQYWKLTNEEWEVFNPDPKIDVRVQKGM
jgi:hypothetical protein